jgi:hypothetical protein
MVINVDFHDPNLKIPAESLINVVAKILNKTDEELLSKTLSEVEIKKLERVKKKKSFYKRQIFNKIN